MNRIVCRICIDFGIWMMNYPLEKGTDLILEQVHCNSMWPQLIWSLMLYQLYLNCTEASISHSDKNTISSQNICYILHLYVNKELFLIIHYIKVKAKKSKWRVQTWFDIAVLFVETGYFLYVSCNGIVFVDLQ